MSWIPDKELSPEVKARYLGAPCVLDHVWLTGAGRCRLYTCI